MNIALCMSGGGLRGLECHTGILQALDELKIIPNTYWGGSAGAIICTLHALGYRGDRIEEILRSLSVDDLMVKKWFWPFRNSIYDRTGTKNILKNLIGEKVATNVNCGVTSYASKNLYFVPGCVDGAMASSAIPEVFEKYYLNMMEYAPLGYYVDSGCIDNIPTPRGVDRECFDLIIIGVTNDDDNPSKHYKTKIGRAVEWLDSSMNREYFQVKNDWDGFPNVAIIKPSPYDSSLLNFSEDYSLISHCKEQAKSFLKTCKFIKNNKNIKNIINH